MPQVLPPYIVFIRAELLVIWQPDESFFWHMKHSPQPMLKPATLESSCASVEQSSKRREKRDEHAVADLELRDTRANGLDDTHALMTEAAGRQSVRTSLCLSMKEEEAHMSPLRSSMMAPL